MDIRSAVPSLETIHILCNSALRFRGEVLIVLVLGANGLSYERPV